MTGIKDSCVVRLRRMTVMCTKSTNLHAVESCRECWCVVPRQWDHWTPSSQWVESQRGCDHRRRSRLLLWTQPLPSHLHQYQHQYQHLTTNSPISLSSSSTPTVHFYLNYFTFHLHWLSGSALLSITVVTLRRAQLIQDAWPSAGG